MVNKIFRGVVAVLGGLLWFIVGEALLEQQVFVLDGWQETVFYILGIIIFAIIFYVISKPLLKAIRVLVAGLERDIRKVPDPDLLTGIGGLVVGLLVAFLVTQPLTKLTLPFVGNIVGIILTVVCYMIFGSLGIMVANQRGKGIAGRWHNFRFSILTKEKNKGDEEEKEKVAIPTQCKNPKILDTSVIIDARIKEIIDSGFLEGTVVIPQFVLEELQHIADSEDVLRRQRGRRGLDLIKAIQDHHVLPIEIVHQDYPDIREVDMKLLRLTRDMEGKVLTNDYNLNKVAKVQGIPVLNINELANAVKPIVIPGEHMEVDLVKEGKERNQGVAYLEDGTMIVVEEGKFHLGKTMNVEVTSVLQTSAGKMIFAKLNS